MHAVLVRHDTASDPARRFLSNAWGRDHLLPAQVNASPKSSKAAQKWGPEQETALAVSGSEPPGGWEVLIDPALRQVPADLRYAPVPAASIAMQKPTDGHEIDSG
jgi:hypothetical protein